VETWAGLKCGDARGAVADGVKRGKLEGGIYEMRPPA